MRETRLSGSEGGGAGRPLSLPLSPRGTTVRGVPPRRAAITGRGVGSRALEDKRPYNRMDVGAAVPSGPRRSPRADSGAWRARGDTRPYNTRLTVNTISIISTGLVYRNPKPHLRAINAMHPTASVAAMSTGHGW